MEFANEEKEKDKDKDVRILKKGKTKTTQYVELAGNLHAFAKRFPLRSVFEHCTAFRDLYFFKHLRHTTITPKVYTVGWNPTKKTIDLYLESFPLDLDEYCVEFAKTFYKKLQPEIQKPYRYHRIIPDYVLKKVFALVLQLDEHKIIHGDLKPTQFLYSPLSTNVVLTDFGFAGFQDCKEIPPMLGWPVDHNSLGCQTFDHNLDESETITSSHVFVKRNLLPYFNRWEFDMAFWISKFAVFDSITKELKPYGRLADSFLPIPIQEQFYQFCKGSCAKTLTERFTRVNMRTHYILCDCNAEII